MRKKLSPHLPTSPHISPHLEALADRGSHISPHLPTSRGPRCGAHKTAVFRPPLERTRIERPSAAGSVALAPMTLTRCHKCTAHAHGAHVEVASSDCVRLASGGEADIVDRCVNVCNCRRRGRMSSASCYKKETAVASARDEVADSKAGMGDGVWDTISRSWEGLPSSVKRLTFGASGLRTARREKRI